jgi:hypothetical protein
LTITEGGLLASTDFFAVSPLGGGFVSLSLFELDCGRRAGYHRFMAAGILAATRQVRRENPGNPAIQLTVP